MEEQNQNDTNERLTKRERRLLKRQEKQAGRQSADSVAPRGSSRRMIIWASAIVGILATIGIIVLLVKSVPSASDIALSEPISAADHTQGNKDAKITLVEYADFQCPACAAYFPLVKQLTEDMKDKVLVAYRYFPLSQIHKNAQLSAYAAEAAGRQGKFWEMHDQLFTGQNAWAESDKAKDIFIQYAQTLKLNIDQFKKDIDSQDVKDLVARNYDGGIKSGVNSTPSFFLNGKKIQPPQSYQAFKQLIDPTVSVSASPSASVAPKP